MLNLIFTLDYEIHGNGEGSPWDLMVEPTDRLLRLFKEYGAKITIMADVAEILKFKEYAEQYGKDDYHYYRIVDQLREALGQGHDVQLHLHASYFKARFNGSHWQQDWSEYNFAALDLERMKEVVRIGKKYLEDLLKPVASNYECTVFRAANWAVSPSRNVVRSLHSNGILIDTSVFKYGCRSGIVSFDYSDAYSDLVPWRVDEDDICKQNATGQLIEMPIYCERRWIGAFLTLNRVRRVLMSRSHRLDNERENGHPGLVQAGRNPTFRAKLTALTRKHAWKADFNQCTGRQLSRALHRAWRKYEERSHEVLPFVLIGHSKLFTCANERSLRPFLDHVATYPARFRFGTFHARSAP